MKQSKCTQNEQIHQNATVDAIQSIHETRNCSKCGGNYKKNDKCPAPMVFNPENVENRTTGSVFIDGRVETKRQVTAPYLRKNSRHDTIKRDLFKIYML